MASSFITKKRIAKAFRDLLATREFDKISIVDIMESAGIRRQTFYNHFLDKYELLDWIFENDLTEYITNNLDFISGQKLLQELFFISNKSVTFIFNFLIFKGKITSMITLSATVACLYQKF
ncbi:dihydroxyacetone kinase transcriptional activator DhaS [Streptococcus mitis]|uniref:dihydroxyacetone kinase transcriptional activator DhaS n=1 Tax=Streptococcus mitis TaxID=28037 RepID=UPI0004D93DA6|nr:dihydroxyacetone kinase transcriptional activator DhaS [Streptococcus mitis]